MFSRARDAAFFVRSQGSGDPTLVATGALTVGPEVLHDVTDPLSRRLRRRDGGCGSPSGGLLGVGALRPPGNGGSTRPSPEWIREPAPPPEALGELFADLAATSLSDTDDPVLIGWARKLFTDDWEALMDWNEMSLGADLRSVVPRVAAPTLVIHGDADAVSSVDGSRRLVEALPRGELGVIEGAVTSRARPDPTRCWLRSRRSSPVCPARTGESVAGGSRELLGHRSNRGLQARSVDQPS